MNKNKKILVAVTGASGMVFLRAFLQIISKTATTVHGICSESGREVLNLELETEPELLPTVDMWFDIKNFAAAPASGSSGYDAMVVMPCTMGTLAAVSAGVSSNLIHRAADVILKERKPLVLAVRETPLNRTHISNMLKAHDAGATICPPLPSYYLKPSTIEEAAETYGWRVADQIGITIEDRVRWGEDV